MKNNSAKCKKNRWLFSLSLFFVFLVACQTQDSKPKIYWEEFTAQSQNEYIIYKWVNMSFDWTLERPGKDDESVFLCISGAKQNKSTGEIIHGYRNLDTSGGETNDDLGYLIIKDGNVELSLDNDGNHGVFFQSEMLIWDEEISTEYSEKLSQNRALIQFNNGNWAIVENKRHANNLTFAQDLLELDVEQAIALQTESFDFGWYRYANIPIEIGRLKSGTKRQNNWFILKGN